MASRLDFSQIRSLYIGTSPSTTVDTNNLIVSGNIGVGTTSPAYKLDVVGTARANGITLNGFTTGTAGGNLELGFDGTQGVVQAYNRTTPDFIPLYFSGSLMTFNPGGTERVRITNSGNVGIGTTAPNNKLSVVGNIEIQSGGSKIGFNVNDAFTAYGISVAHYGISYGFNANPVAISGYFGIGLFTEGSEKVRILGNGNVGIGTTSPSKLLHVAGDQLIDGWLTQGSYSSKGITLPYPGANYGNGRIYLRLCSSASGRIMSARVRISSTWNWAPAFGYVEADITFYWTGSSFAYAYVNILSATGQAATNLTFGALETEGGYVSVPVYSVNSNPIYTYIQASPDTDLSQIGYSSWGNVAFPGQANVYIQTDLGVGTPSPSYRLDVNGVSRFQGQVRFKTDVWQISDSDARNRLYFAPGSRTYFGSGDGYEWRSSGDTALAVITNGGNLGIGTTSPAIYGGWIGLDIRGGNGGHLILANTSATNRGELFTDGNGFNVSAKTNNDLLFKTNDTEKVRITAGGNVGIGTTAPTSKFQVNNNAGTGSAFYVDAGNTPGTTTLFEHTGANTPVPFAITKSGYSGSSVDFGILYIDMAHSVAGGGSNLHFTLRNSSGVLSEYGGLGASIVTNTAGATAGRLNFYTTNGGATRNIRMVIAPNGNVGINTTNPSYNLHVEGDTYTSGDLLVGITNATSWHRISVATGGFIAQSSFKGIGAYQDSTNAEFFCYDYSSGSYQPLVFRTSTLNIANNAGSSVIYHNGTNVGIGTTSPGYKLDVSGTIRATGDVIAYSDARVKENVETLDGALDKVMKMRGVSYNKIGEQEKKVGVIAQEILEVLPEVVSQDETGTYSVAYGNIVSVLIEAIKEQQKQIDELKSKLK